ncbi:MAG TPA: hypothetical protein VL357_05905 [Rariglobus sp.]|jgi:hypothetical protein|nr:hypothetical protein [Rariglobus sp.]
MRLFFSGIVIGVLAAIFPKVALWVCGIAAALGVLGLVGFLILVAWVIAGEPKEGRS